MACKINAIVFEIFCNKFDKGAGKMKTLKIILMIFGILACVAVILFVINAFLNKETVKEYGANDIGIKNLQWGMSEYKVINSIGNDSYKDNFNPYDTILNQDDKEEIFLKYNSVPMSTFGFDSASVSSDMCGASLFFERSEKTKDPEKDRLYNVIVWYTLKKTEELNSKKQAIQSELDLKYKSKTINGEKCWEAGSNTTIMVFNYRSDDGDNCIGVRFFDNRKINVKHMQNIS
jgi:hypothetical protein